VVLKLDRLAMAVTQKRVVVMVMKRWGKESVLIPAIRKRVAVILPPHSNDYRM
jgi:hypothetical protein